MLVKPRLIFIKKYFSSSFLFVSIGSALLVGCVSVPEYGRSTLGDLVSGDYVNTTQSKSKEDLPNEEKESDAIWWKLVGDPVIDSWVEEALTNNYNLNASRARVSSAKESIRIALGSRWPQLVASLPLQRSFVTEEDGSRSYDSSYLLGVSFSWNADLFGKLRHSQRASMAEYASSKASLEAEIHMLIANVIIQRVQIAIAQKRVDLAQRILGSRRQTLNSVERRYNIGSASVSAVEVHLARENFASAQDDLASFNQQYLLSYNALHLLLGRKPSEVQFDGTVLKKLPEMDESIVDIPVELLDRRPDIRASEFNVMAAREGVAISAADLYPDLSLSGSFSWATNQSFNLFSVTNRIGDISSALTQTLFQGGALKASVDESKAELIVAYNLYASEVLEAIIEVENALITNQFLVKRIDTVKRQVLEARRADFSARKRYQRGLSNLLTVLQSEESVQSSENLLLDLELEFWQARVDLHLAIGGKWIEEEKILALEKSDT